jgi:monoamine oxidase
MDGTTIRMALVAIRQHAQSEQEYDAAIQALLAGLTNPKSGMEMALSLWAKRPREKERKPRSKKRKRAGGYKKVRLQGNIALAVEEAYGSEAPGPGWELVEEGRWEKRRGKKPKKDGQRVGIIGGGPGGLFAAWLLNQKAPELEVVLFEASDRLGGKILTEEFDDGTPFEAGVAELYEYPTDRSGHSGGKDALRLLIEKDLGLKTHDMQGGAAILGDKVLPDLDAVEEEFGAATRKRIEHFHRRCAQLMSIEQYTTRWQPDNAHPWANKTFRECVEEECEGDANAVAYIMTAVHSDLATEGHLSNGLNGLKNVLMDNPEYLRLYHVEGGVERIVDALEGVLDAEAHMGARVMGIRTEQVRALKRYRVDYRADGRDAHEEFDAVVCAVPNHWLTQLRWEAPALRERMRALEEHYDRPAHYFRISLEFRTAWWRRLAVFGDFWMIDVLGGCCCYDESARWGAEEGHVLSFLIAGQDALMLAAHDQSDRDVVEHLLEALPACMQADARAELIEARVHRWLGSINAVPGGFPAKELKGQHQPDPDGHPGLVIACDAFFDSTLNGALMSASVATDLLLEHLGVEKREPGKTVAQLDTAGGSLSVARS